MVLQVVDNTAYLFIFLLKLLLAVIKSSLPWEGGWGPQVDDPDGEALDSDPGELSSLPWNFSFLLSPEVRLLSACSVLFGSALWWPRPLLGLPRPFAVCPCRISINTAVLKSGRSQPNLFLLTALPLGFCAWIFLNLSFPSER